jgi:hypothetical protein
MKKDGVVQVQAREHTSMKQEWAGIKGQDAFTNVFRTDPPSEMVDVPDTQRRDLLSEEQVGLMRESIKKLGVSRHIDEDLLAEVLRGVDSLGDEADLEFDWDLSRLLNRDGGAANVVVDDDEKADDDEESFAYKYQLTTVVMIRPLSDDLSFWLGKVVSLGDGDRSGQYEVWWLEAQRMYGTYHLCYRNNKPLMDWQSEDSIQDSVVMVANGKKLNAKSVKLIGNYMQRWKQAVEEEAAQGDLEPDVFPSDDDDINMD